MAPFSFLHEVSALLHCARAVAVESCGKHMDTPPAFLCKCMLKDRQLSCNRRRAARGMWQPSGAVLGPYHGCCIVPCRCRQASHLIKTYPRTACALGGAQLVACDSPVGRLGLSVCYDLRFPAVYQELVHTRGAEVLLVPSAFTVRTGAKPRPRDKCRAVSPPTFTSLLCKIVINSQHCARLHCFSVSRSREGKKQACAAAALREIVQSLRVQDLGPDTFFLWQARRTGMCCCALAPSRRRHLCWLPHRRGGTLTDVLLLNVQPSMS